MVFIHLCIHSVIDFHVLEIDIREKLLLKGFNSEYSYIFLYAGHELFLIATLVAVKCNATTNSHQLTSLPLCTLAHSDWMWWNVIMSTDELMNIASFKHVFHIKLQAFIDMPESQEGPSFLSFMASCLHIYKKSAN